MGIQGDLFDLCVGFIEENKFSELMEEYDDEEGEEGDVIRQLDAQMFFETVGEEKILDFFNELCRIFEQ